ncbi:PREDICTED: uncharacterized protein LOC106308590 [Brassica oleracea var. oleracea]|uniref:uncharacterized protein LOC106308590 n=1 Tax=Brassica oleracea var. oleracea TaxID=109376 RepID=UPI0006A6E96D|nr:PREDICTED: uncharacterized protein LOC106308590 [Brassica oleracea var. oleracea]
MGDINANDVPNQANINAQLLAGQAQLTATMNAVTEQLARLEHGNRPNGLRPRRRNHPYLEDPQLHSDEDSSDSEPPNREEPRPVQAEREGRREHRIQGDGSPIRRRCREDEVPWKGGKDLKLNPATFAGKVNPDAYVGWERRMEYIFEYYNYSEARKIALAAAQLTDNALSWWDREMSEAGRVYRVEAWEDMRSKLRTRYVPAYYQRDLQKCFRKLSQGTRTVEEYCEEFESLRNKLKTRETQDTLMAQFMDGLQDRIARKVERQQYETFHDLLHFAIQAEQHIKRKNESTAKGKGTWTQLASKGVYKGKSIEVENRFKKNQAEQSKTGLSDQGKNQAQNQRTRDITCFKCRGKGHYARDFPNKRVMVLKADGEYESQDEAEVEPLVSYEEVVDYAETRELLVTRRSLSALFDPETIQRENIFHTRCSVEQKVFSLIIDGGSCTNVASNIGKYHDQVKCDAVPMQAGHILLGRPWQFDKETIQYCRTNVYSFSHNNKKHSLAPLSPQEVYEMHQAMDHSSKVLLMVFREGCFAGIEAQELPAEVQGLMEQYKDVFPDEIPAGLPPI